MIWSTKTEALRRSELMLRTAKPPMLKSTNTLVGTFAERSIPFEPVPYIEVPPVVHKIGKIVVAYAAIDSRGKLNQGLPYFYAVTGRPNTQGFESPAGARRSQEAHVVAEDLSLKRGILTPFARATSEILVASMMPDSMQKDYLGDRIAHLEALTKEASGSDQLYPKQELIVVEELELAIEALQQRLT